MDALLFNLKKTIKNAILDLLHSPFKLVVYSMLTLLVIYSLFSSQLQYSDLPDNFLDIRFLNGGLMFSYMMIGIPIIVDGLKSGANFFNMSDVNISFVSPLSSKLILVFAMIKKMGFMLFFIACLMTWVPVLRGSFGITTSEAAIIIASMVLYVFLIQILTLFAYIFSNSNPNRILFIKTILYGSVALAGLFCGGYLIFNGVNFNTIAEAISSKILNFIPIFGWLKAFVFGLIQSNTFDILLFGSLLLCVIIPSMAIFFKSNTDYYEDVIQNAESSFEIRTTLKQGKISDKMLIGGNKKGKVGKNGIFAGKGASAFFFKQIKEKRRRTNIMFINANTIVLMFLATILTFVFKSIKMDPIPGVDSTELHPNFIMMLVTFICVYVQFFFNAYSDWNKELTKPYLFIVPAPPFKKLLWASALSLIKPVTDAILTFGLVFFLCKGRLMTLLMCVLLYISFGFVYTSSNLLSNKFLGKQNNRGLIMILYVFTLMLLLSPGIFMSCLSIVFIDVMYAAFCLIPAIVWNFILSIIMFICCNSALNNMDSQ